MLFIGPHGSAHEIRSSQHRHTHPNDSRMSLNQRCSAWIWEMLDAIVCRGDGVLSALLIWHYLSPRPEPQFTLIRYRHCD